MNLSFVNRIAFHYMIATAAIMTIVFMTVFFYIKTTIISNIDKDLLFEAKKHSTEITVLDNEIHFLNLEEWEEREHQEVQVNPVFVQLSASDGTVMDKSPNLKFDSLHFINSDQEVYFDDKINDKRIRQLQLPIKKEGKIEGYITTAISSESAWNVINSLREILIASYILILTGLFFISRYLATRTIRPVKEMTNTIRNIRKYNLSERVVLPENKDELYHLAKSFNELLERIESAISREKQFTSDASHELRTPLASLRGNLEVLIRKERPVEEYKNEIKHSLEEIDRMTAITDQLLVLARMDKYSKEYISKHVQNAVSIVDECIHRYLDKLNQKRIKIDLDIQENIYECELDAYYSKLIIENVLSNAIKYSHTDSTIVVRLQEKENKVELSIIDEGIGIKEADMDKLFQHFYRSEALSHKEIKGNGLGLSIVQKATEMIDAKIEIQSRLGEGTQVRLVFQNILSKA